MVSGISAGISDSGSCLVWMVITGIDDDRIDAGRTGRRDSEAGSRSSTVRGRSDSSSDPAGAETDNEDGTCRAHCLWRLEHCAGIGADRNCCIGRRWSKYRLSTVETVVSPAGV